MIDLDFGLHGRSQECYDTGSRPPATAVPCFAESGFRFTLSAASRVHGLRFRCLGFRGFGIQVFRG